jgi:hypothetical protein
MCAAETALYKVTFACPVVVKGTVYGGLAPFKAAYLTTGEGPAFRRVVPDGFWDSVDIRLYDRQFDDLKALPIKITLAIPKGWDTALVLGLIVYHVRNNNTLSFYSESARIWDLFEWFLQDANAVDCFLQTQDVYKSIESTMDTHLS